VSGRAALLFFLAFGAACASSASSSNPSAAPVEDAAPPVESEDSGASARADGGTTSPSAATSSGGKGGLTCTKTESLEAGRTACVAKLGSVEVKLVEAKGGSGPYRLALYLHGDGAGAHKSGSALKTMLPFLDDKHGLGVSLLAPNGCAWWQKPSYDCSGSANAPDTTAENSKALVAALEALYAAFDVRLDGVAYYGSSGGSIFLTEQWLPLHGKEYFGVFALMCGGRAPRQTFAWDTTDAKLVAKMPLFFTYGDQDFLATEIGEAMTAFEAKKFSVTKKVIPGAQHCAFNAHAEAVAVWQTAF
jgi:hypothetical protein